MSKYGANRWKAIYGYKNTAHYLKTVDFEKDPAYNTSVGMVPTNNDQVVSVTFSYFIIAL